jgi:hypothetical protein
MFERPVDVFPRARIVYQDHSRDRDPAKHIERYEALAFYRSHRRRILAQTFSRKGAKLKTKGAKKDFFMGLAFHLCAFA